jgi:hypothetical protein
VTTMTDVQRRLGEVGEALNRATGGQALCRLDGAATTAKELEGRMAVLLELRRALRRDPDADLGAIDQRWRDDLAARTAAGASQAWVAYLTGGVAELDVLARS